MRLSEIYVSSQGEGPRVGVPTTFVRFAGCNLRCPGWPCDTPYAIDPAVYRNEWTTFTVQQVMEKIDPSVQNVCLTGGEPFLQPAVSMQGLILDLYDRGHTIEAFTNGTVPWPERTERWCSFIMDWKLPGSGEKFDSNARIDNLGRMGDGDAVKFTLKDEEDFYAAIDIYNDYVVDLTQVEVFVGRVWESKELTDAAIVQLVQANNLSWRLNVQLHKYIWPPEARGT